MGIARELSTSRPRRRAQRKRIAGGLFLLLALGGCSGGVLDPKGPVGAAQKAITIDALAIMLAIIIPTIIVTYLFAWWYRASNTRAEYRPDWAYSGRLELLVWAIPVLVIVFLGGVIWVGSHLLDPARPLPPGPGGAREDVEVIALDWKWLFIYPREGIASVNQLVLPAGVPVRFRVTSGSVMNTFFIPQLGGMIYAMHGMETNLNLQADQPGTFYGRSAQFSGDGFPDMHFVVRSVPAQDFAAWAAQTRSAGRVLDAAAFRELQRQSFRDPVSTFGAVQNDPFLGMVRRDLPPGPGPELPGTAGRNVTPVSGKRS